MFEVEACQPKTDEDVPSAKCSIIAELASKLSESLRHKEKTIFLKVGSENATFFY